MIQSEWLACVDPASMLDFLMRCYNKLPSKPLGRKIRLIGCMLARLIQHRMPDPRSRRAIVVAERFADGQTGNAELTDAHQQARAYVDEVTRHINGYHEKRRIAYCAPWLAVHLTSSGDTGSNLWMDNHTLRRLAFISGMRFECNVEVYFTRLFREMINPYRAGAVQILPQWRNEDVMRLAETAYMAQSDVGHLDNTTLAILADALEDVGCEERITNPLRVKTPRHRGWHLLDVILEYA